jgi:SAM-dependent methyltransferase
MPKFRKYVGEFASEIIYLVIEQTVGLRQTVAKLIPDAVKRTAIYKAVRPVPYHDSIYDETYFKSEVEGPALASAPAMARTIAEHFQPHSVVDVGCGTGALLVAFRDLGCSVSGLEYAEVALRYCRERNLDVRKFDIERQVLKQAGRSDLAVSFEVAEHLPEERADRFVDLLCSLAPVVVCSAAKPEQGGLDHVNCQPQSYWIEKFERRGYRFDRVAADALRAEWRAQGVTGYYYENVMAFRRAADRPQ